MRKILMAAMIVGLLAAPAFAQSVKDKLLALNEGLNDPNPIIRIAVLDEALADDSATVRNYAMGQALASEDADLKSMALTKFFETRKQITVIVKKSPKLTVKEATIEDEEALITHQRNERHSYGILKSYAPSIIYLIKSFNSRSGELKGYCMKGATSTSENSKFTGSFVGDKITIEHSCYQVSSSYEDCTLQLQLSNDAKYVGTMRCSGENYPAVVEIPLK